MKIKIKIISIIQFVLLIIIIISGVRILNWQKENNHNNEVLEKSSIAVTVEKNENENKYNVDFNELKSQNVETVGWIKVNGTLIEHPVVKTDNNDFYLTHSFDKKYNSSGWVFADYRNKFNGTDKNIIIYGHNRRNESMFGTLKNILKSEWYDNEENYIIPLITEYGNLKYKVFSVYKIVAEDYYLQTDFEDGEFEEFAETLKSRSIKKFNVDVNENDSILTLSSCANDSTYRVVLHAKRIE